MSKTEQQAVNEAESQKGFFHRVPLLIAAAVILFHAIAGTYWIYTNQVIQGSDEVDYFHSAQRFERYWPKDWSSPIVALKKITSYPAYAPAAPLSLILAKIAGGIFGKSLATYRMISFAAYLLTLLLLFFLGKKILGDWGGMLAVVLFVGFPYAFIQSRFYNGFAINSFLILAAVYLLLSSKHLTRWQMMAGFGIMTGLALLAERGTPPIILIGPAIAYGIQALARHLRSRPVNIAWAVGFSVMAAGLALIIAGRYVFAYAITSTSHNQEMMTVPYYPDRAEFSYYLPKIIRWITGQPLALLLFIATIWALVVNKIGRIILGVLVVLFLILSITPIPMYTVRPWLMLALFLAAFCIYKDEQCPALIAWIVVPLLVFSSFATKDLEYIYSLIPAFALVAAALLTRLSDAKRVRQGLAVLITILFVIGTLQFLAVSFPNGPARSTYMKLPSVFRFANGHESYGPKPSTRRQKANQAIATLGIKGPGVLIYFPESWEADQERGLPAQYESGGSQWMTELQIQIDFLTQGQDHFVFNQKCREGKPWADQFEDAIFWYPMTKEKLRQFRKEVGLDNYAYIFSAMSPDMEDRILKILPPIEGKQIGSLELFPGREVGLWILGQGFQ